MSCSFAQLVRNSSMYTIPMKTTENTTSNQDEMFLNSVTDNPQHLVTVRFPQ